MTAKPIVSTGPKSKQIIVAKYKENLSWTKQFKDIPLIVYDKSDADAPNFLPNIPIFPAESFDGLKHAATPTGRESHTYLFHILKNYDNLADMNVFLQGSPEEHQSNAMDPLRILFENDFKDIEYLPLIHPLIICDKRAAPMHTGLPLERVFQRLFKGDCPPLFAYSWGAMFCVSGNYLRKKPKAFYEEMMQIIYEEALSGYVYERLWPTILACHDFIPHDHFPKHDKNLWDLPELL